MNKLPPNAPPSNKFLESLRPEVRAFLGRVTGGDLTNADPPPPDLSKYNHVQRRTIARATANNRPLRPEKRPQQRKAELRRQARLKDSRYLERLRARLEFKGYDAQTLRGVRAFPAQLWAMNAHILTDPTEKAARIYLRGCYHQIGARIVEKVARGEHNRPLTHPIARYILALGLSMLALSKETRRAGLWGRIIKAVPMTAYAALLRHPVTGHRPSLSAIAGAHGRQNATKGYLDQLREGGLFYCQQLPKDAVSPIEKLGDYAVNRYWLISNGFHGPLTDEEVDELLQIYPYSEIHTIYDLSSLHPSQENECRETRRPRQNAAIDATAGP